MIQIFRPCRLIGKHTLDHKQFNNCTSVGVELYVHALLWEKLYDNLLSFGHIKINLDDILGVNKFAN
jgi:hypothetical protein